MAAPRTLFRSSTATATTCMSRAWSWAARRISRFPTRNQTTDRHGCRARATRTTPLRRPAGRNVFPSVVPDQAGHRGLNGEGCGSSWQCMSTHCEKTTADCGVCAPRAAGRRRVHRRRGLHAGPGVRRAEVRHAGARWARACSAKAPCRAATSIAARQQHLRDAAGAGRAVRERHRARATSGRASSCNTLSDGAEVRDRRRREGRPAVRPRQQHADHLHR